MAVAREPVESTGKARGWRDVGAAEDFPELRMKIVSVSDRLEIGVVRVGDDDVYAVRNVCPHQAGPLCKGPVRPAMGVSRVGQLASAPDELVIACAWHGWEYYLATGRSVAETRDRARVYPARIREGRIEVEL